MVSENIKLTLSDFHSYPFAFTFTFTFTFVGQRIRDFVNIRLEY